MKNLITIALLLFLTLTTSSCALLSKAQIKAGVDIMRDNFQSSLEEITDNNPPNTDLAKNKVKKENESISDSSNRTGFYVGIALPEISFSEKFGVQPEVNFIGVKDFNQIQVPILLKYNFANKFNAYGGPNFGFLLDAPSGLTNFNFALDLGLSYDITNNLLVEARYGWGLTNLLDGGNSNNYLKLNNFQLGLAYRFSSKK